MPPEIAVVPLTAIVDGQLLLASLIQFMSISVVLLEVTGFGSQMTDFDDPKMG